MNLHPLIYKTYGEAPKTSHVRLYNLQMLWPKHCFKYFRFEDFEGICSRRVLESHWVAAVFMDQVFVLYTGSPSANRSGSTRFVLKQDGPRICNAHLNFSFAGFVGVCVR